MIWSAFWWRDDKKKRFELLTSSLVYFHNNDQSTYIVELWCILYWTSSWLLVIAEDITLL